MSKKNEMLNIKFNEFDESKKMEILGIGEDIFSVTRFKGIARETVINDLWNAKTNSEKRNLLK